MNIKKVEKEDLEEIITVAVAAFHDTPLYRYIAPDVGERELFLRVFFSTRFHGGFGTSVMEAAQAEEGGRIVGTAIWTPPDNSPPATPQAAEAQGDMAARMRARFEEPMTQAGIGAPVLNRCMELMQTLAASAVKNPQSPHWQLAPIFILPAFQGRGIGSALMRKQFAVIDEAKLPITLTTQEQGNVELYTHYGFKLTSETPIGKSGVLSWGMCRY